MVVPIHYFFETSVKLLFNGDNLFLLNSITFHLGIKTGNLVMLHPKYLTILYCQSVCRWIRLFLLKILKERSNGISKNCLQTLSDSGICKRFKIYCVLTNQELGSLGFSWCTDLVIEWNWFYIEIVCFGREF